MHPYPLSPQNLIETISGWIRGPAIPDLSGKVAVVSGFNSGIGYHTTKALLEHGAEVSQQKVESASHLQERHTQKRRSCYGKTHSLSGHLPGCACACRLGRFEQIAGACSA